MLTPSSPNVNAGVARSLGLPRSLGAHVGAIFEGLDNLGSSPAVIVSMARRALGGPGRVLDLACGKGGVAVALAERLGCSVVGVDACAPFVKSARVLARSKGVGRRCRFRVGDVREFRGDTFDLAIMLGLFGVEEAAPLLRRRVHVGGVYLVDDAIRVGRRLSDAGVPTLRALRRVLTSLGDTILEERVATLREIERGSVTGAISRRCERLARERPELSRSLARFVAGLEASSEVLRGAMRPVVWVVRKGP